MPEGGGGGGGGEGADSSCGAKRMWVKRKVILIDRHSTCERNMPKYEQKSLYGELLFSLKIAVGREVTG